MLVLRQNIVRFLKPKFNVFFHVFFEISSPIFMNLFSCFLVHQGLAPNPSYTVNLKIDREKVRDISSCVVKTAGIYGGNFELENRPIFHYFSIF